MICRGAQLERDIKNKRLGYISEAELKDMLDEHGVPAIDLGEFDIEQEAIDLIPKSTAENYLCIPVNRAGASLIVAMANPGDTVAIKKLASIAGCNVEVVATSEQAVRNAIRKYYPERQ